MAWAQSTLGMLALSCCASLVLVQGDRGTAGVPMVLRACQSIPGCPSGWHWDWSPFAFAHWELQWGHWPQSCPQHQLRMHWDFPKPASLSSHTSPWQTHPPKALKHSLLRAPRRATNSFGD